MKNLKLRFLYFFAKKYMLKYYLVDFLEHYKKSDGLYLCVALYDFTRENNLSDYMYWEIYKCMRQYHDSSENELIFWDRYDTKLVRIEFLNNIIKSL